MSFTPHHKHPNRVRFSADIQDTEVGYRVQRATKTEPATGYYEAPHFPNLYKMFKPKPKPVPAMSADKGVVEKVENVVENSSGDDDEEKVVPKSDDNVDTAASEYIKRKRHNLSLQKLVSMMNVK